MISVKRPLVLVVGVLGILLVAAPGCFDDGKNKSGENPEMGTPPYKPGDEQSANPQETDSSSKNDELDKDHDEELLNGAWKMSEVACAGTVDLSERDYVRNLSPKLILSKESFLLSSRQAGKNITRTRVRVTYETAKQSVIFKIAGSEETLGKIKHHDLAPRSLNAPIFDKKFYLAEPGGFSIVTQSTDELKLISNEEVECVRDGVQGKVEIAFSKIMKDPADVMKAANEDKSEDKPEDKKEDKKDEGQSADASDTRRSDESGKPVSPFEQALKDKASELKKTSQRTSQPTEAQKLNQAKRNLRPLPPLPPKKPPASKDPTRPAAQNLADQARTLRKVSPPDGRKKAEETPKGEAAALNDAADQFIKKFGSQDTNPTHEVKEESWDDEPDTFSRAEPGPPVKKAPDVSPGVRKYLESLAQQEAQVRTGTLPVQPLEADPNLRTGKVWKRPAPVSSGKTLQEQIREKGSAAQQAGEKVMEKIEVRPSAKPSEEPSIFKDIKSRRAAWESDDDSDNDDSDDEDFDF